MSTIQLCFWANSGREGWTKVKLFRCVSNTTHSRPTHCRQWRTFLAFFRRVFSLIRRAVRSYCADTEVQRRALRRPGRGRSYLVACRFVSNRQILSGVRRWHPPIRLTLRNPFGCVSFKCHRSRATAERAALMKELQRTASADNQKMFSRLRPAARCTIRSIYSCRRGPTPLDNLWRTIFSKHEISSQQLHFSRCFSGG